MSELEHGELRSVLERQDFWDNIEDETDDIGSFKCQYSTQVNMDDQAKNTENISYKKNKKKEYKRRKREKDHESQQRAQGELTSIINQIYAHKTTFIDNNKQIEECLTYLQGGDKFHQFLNNTIRSHVKYLQKTIWEYTQTILHENLQEKPETIQFYLKMVEEMYKHYESIKQSSKEISKIINLYVRITSQQDRSFNDQYNYRDLDKNTFNYLIESDQTLKNLMHACDRKIDLQYLIQKGKLKTMIEVLRFCEIRDYDNEEDDNLDYDEEWTDKSTSIQEEEFTEEKKRKKKRKFRQSELRSQFEDVIRRLNSFTIDQDERLPCRVPECWIEQIEQSIPHRNKKKKE